MDFLLYLRKHGDFSLFLRALVRDQIHTDETVDLVIAENSNKREI